MKIVECSILKSCELVCTYFGLMRVHPFGGTMSLKVFDVQRKCVFRIHDMCDKFLLIIYYVIYIIFYYNTIYIYIYIYVWGCYLHTQSVIASPMDYHCSKCCGATWPLAINYLSDSPSTGLLSASCILYLVHLPWYFQVISRATQARCSCSHGLFIAWSLSFGLLVQCPR